MWVRAEVGEAGGGGMLARRSIYSYLSPTTSTQKTPREEEVDDWATRSSWQAESFLDHLEICSAKLNAVGAR